MVRFGVSMVAWAMVAMGMRKSEKEKERGTEKKEK